MKKENIKECSIKLKRITMPAAIANRLKKNSNDDNLQTLSTIDHGDENLNYEFEPSTDNDPPNNCFTPEDFCQNYQDLINIVNAMINRQQEHGNKPFDIERTIADGLRAGTWALNNYQGHYIISKLDDNNRILQAKKIHTMYFFPEQAAPKGSKTKYNDNNTKDEANEDTKSRKDNDIQTTKSTNI